MQNIVIYGLILNFIGTIFLSIPTVNGVKYISKILNPIKHLIDKLLIFTVSIGLFWYFILHSIIPIDYFIFSFFSDNISTSDILKLFYIPFGIFTALILLFVVLEKSITWITADNKYQKEKEKRIGAIGIGLILIGFVLQMIDTICKS